MFRKTLKIDDPTHPEIIDIEVQCLYQESSIDFKPLEDKQKGKQIMVKLVKKNKRERNRERKEDEKEDHDRIEQEQEGSAEPRDGDVAGAVDPEDKMPRQLPDYLKANAKYSFINRNLVKKNRRERNRERKEEEERDRIEQEDDSAEPRDRDVAGAVDPKDKKPRQLPDYLKATAKYNFNNRNVVLCFYDEDFDWSLVSIMGSYDFSETKIAEETFVEITGKDFVYNITPTGNAKAKVFKLDISNIDRHILMKRFSVNLSYLFLDDADMKFYNTKYSLEVPFFQQETRLQFKFLGHYHADRGITVLYNHKFKFHPGLSQSDLRLLRELDQYQRKKLTERTTGNSTQMIKYALNIEDLESQDELKDFTLCDVSLDGLMSSYRFPAKRKQIPPNFEEMSLCLVPMNKYVKGHINFEDDCIFAQMEEDAFEDGYVYFEKTFPWQRDGTRRMIDLETTYFIRFIPNRITYRACFQALDSITQSSLQHYFDDFEDEPMNCTRDNGEKVDRFEWYNEQIGTNDEQMTAIKNIVNCTAYPFPYVVFGPPGTGKTSCIVECIAQILKAKPNSRIMVTAQSNSACDEVGVRLLKYISQSKIFRFYSPSLLNPKNGDTSEILRKTSNLRGKRNQYPTEEEFCHFNVVIVTLMSCSRLVQLDVQDMNKNFDYIFVDECAAAMEPEAFVPIIGLGTDFDAITTNIILLGDHKQLGPVISSDIAARLGLGVSLMERIMSKRRYQMKLTDNFFDKNYVTQLLDNFRSHPAILQFSNVLFYESKLRAKIQEPEKSFGTKWNYLNNKKFPLLFHCSKEPSKVIKGGTSSYNPGEIKLVRFYIDLLLRVGIGGVKVDEDDIGVVSPYKAQLNMLRKELRHAPKVEIGTAEYYQGREKKIIIISTVKSGSHVGFLKSEKRLNVCITRAKSLLILVGNADTLMQNSLWNSFMHFAQANKACCGDNFTLQRLTTEEQKILDELNSVFSQLSVDEDAEPVFVRDEALKAIEERMKKVQELMKEM